MKLPETTDLRFRLRCRTGGARGVPALRKLANRCTRTVIVLFLGLLSECVAAAADHLSDETLAKIHFEQKLNAQVAAGLMFRDEDGNSVRLGNYFDKRPIVLVLGYYGCPMLCTLVLNGMVETMQDLRWTIGKEFTVVNVSIDAKETPELAAAKKRTCLKRYGRSGAEAGWHFLTGNEASIRKLADEVGFQFAYDEAAKQYAHPSGFLVLTPDGKISRYFLGVTFSPKDLHQALEAAADRGIGTRIQDLILLCFHYRPVTGKFAAAIMLSVRTLGIATLLGLAWLIFRGTRHNRTLNTEHAMRNTPGPAPAPNPAPHASPITHQTR